MAKNSDSILSESECFSRRKIASGKTCSTTLEVFLQQQEAYSSQGSHALHPGSPALRAGAFPSCPEV